MAYDHGFVQPLKALAHEDRVRGKDVFTHTGCVGWLKKVSVEREADLQTADGLRPGKNRQVVSLVILLVDLVLHRFFRKRGARGAPVSNFSNVMQPQTPRWNHPRSG